MNPITEWIIAACSIVGVLVVVWAALKSKWKREDEMDNQEDRFKEQEEKFDNKLTNLVSRQELFLKFGDLKDEITKSLTGLSDKIFSLESKHGDQLHKIDLQLVKMDTAFQFIAKGYAQALHSPHTQELDACFKIMHSEIESNLKLPMASRKVLDQDNLRRILEIVTIIHEDENESRQERAAMAGLIGFLHYNLGTMPPA